MSKITFKGSPLLQSRLMVLVLEFIDVFATKVRREPAAVKPMKLSIDNDKWRLPWLHLVDTLKRSRRKSGNKLMLC